MLTTVGFKVQMLRVADLSDCQELLLRPSKSGQFWGCLKPKGNIESIAFAQYQAFINSKQLVCHAAVQLDGISDHGLSICSQPPCMLYMHGLSGWCHTDRSVTLAKSHKCFHGHHASQASPACLQASLCVSQIAVKGCMLARGTPALQKCGTCWLGTQVWYCRS